LDELERIPRLRFDIDADDIEAGLVVAHSGATGAAKQVEQPRPPLSPAHACGLGAGHEAGPAW
jgi:hypothetical protein